MSNGSSIAGWSLLLIALGLLIYLASSLTMVAGRFILPTLGFIAAATGTPTASTSRPSTNWYPPKQTQLEDLESVIHGSGVYGFIFNNSYAPSSNTYYGGYNWCNMPSVNKQTYVTAPEQYNLEYVEVVSVRQPDMQVRSADCHCRYTGIINALRTRPIHFPEKAIPGNVMTKGYSTMADR